MRYFQSLLAFVFFFSAFTAFSQSRPQIRLKIGVAKPFAPAREAYAYKVKTAEGTMETIALEYNNPLNSFFSSWYVGISIDPQRIEISPNLSNFQSITNSNKIIDEHSTQRVYAGLCKRIGAKDQKNQFELNMGIGLAFAPSNIGGPGWLKPGSEGTTIRGEQFKSPYYNAILLSGYFSTVYAEPRAIIAPTLDLGLRWQLRNKKQNDVIGLELMGNYGLLRYFDYEIPYTVDGIAHEDKFGERGINAQLNLIIPLKNFGKKRKGHG